MKTKLKKLMHHLNVRTLSALTKKMESTANADALEGDTHLLSLFRLHPDFAKAARSRKSTRRRSTKKAALCPAVVAMSEAVALEEITNFLDMLVPDTRYIGKKWSVALEERSANNA